MQDFFFNAFLVASFVFLGLGLVIAFTIAVLGYFRSAMSVAWGALTFALVFFCMAWWLAPALEVEGGDASGTGPDALSGEEARMVPAFRDCTDRIVAVTARLEGLVEGAGSLSAAEMGVADDLRWELWVADPDSLYVPGDSEALSKVQDLLSRAWGRFREACDELPVASGDRGDARKDYRAGAKLLTQGERLLTELEARVPDE